MLVWNDNTIGKKMQIGVPLLPTKDIKIFIYYLILYRGSNASRDWDRTELQ